jgi:hypothetical protein
MNKFYSLINTATESIFGIVSIVYMFLSYVEKEHTKSHEYLVLALLGFISMYVLKLVHKQEKLEPEKQILT